MKELLMGQRLSRMREKRAQERPLRRREMNRLVVAKHAASLIIHHQLAERRDRGFRRARCTPRTAKLSTYSGHQLDGAERLRHVVVRTCIEQSSFFRIAVTR